MKKDMTNEDVVKCNKNKSEELANGGGAGVSLGRGTEGKNTVAGVGLSDRSKTRLSEEEWLRK